MTATTLDAKTADALPCYEAWETACAASLAKLARCSVCDAQGLMEAQPFEMARLWAQAVPAESAATVLHFVSQADPGGWGAQVRRALQELHGYRPDRAAVLMADRFETLQILRSEGFTVAGAAAHLVFCVDLAPGK